MNDSTILTLAKTSLQISGTAYDSALGYALETAKAAVTREGITIADTNEDGYLLSMYTCYLWAKRRTNEPMPRMLRYALNNRLLSEKGAVANG